VIRARQTDMNRYDYRDFTTYTQNCFDITSMSPRVIKIILAHHVPGHKDILGIPTNPKNLTITKSALLRDHEEPNSKRNELFATCLV
jgi:hypothetical protein